MNTFKTVAAIILFAATSTHAPSNRTPKIKQNAIKVKSQPIGRGWAFINDSTVLIENRDTINILICHYRKDSTILLYDHLYNMTRLSPKGYERLEPFRKLGHESITNL